MRILTKRPEKREQENRNQVNSDAPVGEEESANLRSFLLNILVLEKLQDRIQRFHFDHSKLFLTRSSYQGDTSCLSRPRSETANYSRMLTSRHLRTPSLAPPAAGFRAMQRWYEMCIPCWWWVEETGGRSQMKTKVGIKSNTFYLPLVFSCFSVPVINLGEGVLILTVRMTPQFM